MKRVLLGACWSSCSRRPGRGPAVARVARSYAGYTGRAVRGHSDRRRAVGDRTTPRRRRGRPQRDRVPVRGRPVGRGTPSAGGRIPVRRAADRLGGRGQTGERGRLPPADHVPRGPDDPADGADLREPRLRPCRGIRRRRARRPRDQSLVRRARSRRYLFPTIRCECGRSQLVGRMVAAFESADAEDHSPPAPTASASAGS